MTFVNDFYKTKKQNMIEIYDRALYIETRKKGKKGKKILTFYPFLVEKSKLFAHLLWEKRF